MPCEDESMLCGMVIAPGDTLPADVTLWRVDVVGGAAELTGLSKMMRTTSAVYPASALPVSVSLRALISFRLGNSVIACIVMLTSSAPDGGTRPEMDRFVSSRESQSAMGCVSMDTTASVVLHSRDTRSISTHVDR